MDKKITVLLLDDQKTNLDIVEDLLSEADDIELIGYYQYSTPFKYHLEKNPPDIALLDIQLSEPLSGMDVLRWIQAYHPKVKTIMLTAERTFITDSLEQGALSYVLKEKWIELPNAIRMVYHGETVIPNHVAEVLVQNLSDERLNRSLSESLKIFTDREIELLRLLWDSQDKDVIIRKMGISPFTYKRHIQNIREKSGIHDLDQLVEKYRDVL